MNIPFVLANSIRGTHSHSYRLLPRGTMVSKRKYNGGYSRSVRRRTYRPYRHTAATRIQRAFRRRRTGTFTRRVQRAVISREPVQYDTKLLFDDDVTQAPIIAHIPNLFFNNDPAVTNVQEKNMRTSTVVKALNMNLQFRINAGKDGFNDVTLMIVRHKRSEPIEQADLRNANNVEPELTKNDHPFMNLRTGVPAPSVVLNFNAGATKAMPDMLTKYTNPKVVDIMWSKTVTVQPLANTNPAGSEPTTFPSGWKWKRDFEYNHRFNEVWKFPTAPPLTSDRTMFPYNNKCYSLIAVSDSLATSASHPTLYANMRLSFKDID